MTLRAPEAHPAHRGHTQTAPPSPPVRRRDRSASPRLRVRKRKLARCAAAAPVFPRRAAPGAATIWPRQLHPRDKDRPDPPRCNPRSAAPARSVPTPPLESRSPATAAQFASRRPPRAVACSAPDAATAPKTGGTAPLSPVRSRVAAAPGSDDECVPVFDGCTTLILTDPPFIVALKNLALRLQRTERNLH